MSMTNARQHAFVLELARLGAANTDDLADLPGVVVFLALAKGALRIGDLRGPHTAALGQLSLTLGFVAAPPLSELAERLAQLLSARPSLASLVLRFFTLAEESARCGDITNRGRFAHVLGQVGARASTATCSDTVRSGVLTQLLLAQFQKGG